MEAYSAAKERIFLNQDKGDYAILNYDDDRVRAMADAMTGTVRYFSTNGEVLKELLSGRRPYSAHDGQDTVVCAESELHLFGKHNIQNCLAAILLTYAAGASLDVIRQVLRSFKGVEHRLEKVRTIHDVTYYNDSKVPMSTPR